MVRETIFMPMLASSPDEDISLLIFLLNTGLPVLVKSERGGVHDMHQTRKNKKDCLKLNVLDIIQET